MKMTKSFDQKGVSQLWILIGVMMALFILWELSQIPEFFANKDREYFQAKNAATGGSSSCPSGDLADCFKRDDDDFFFTDDSGKAKP